MIKFGFTDKNLDWISISDGVVFSLLSNVVDKYIARAWL